MIIRPRIRAASLTALAVLLFAPVSGCESTAPPPDRVLPPGGKYDFSGDPDLSGDVGDSCDAYSFAWCNTHRGGLQVVQCNPNEEGEMVVVAVEECEPLGLSCLEDNGAAFCGVGPLSPPECPLSDTTAEHGSFTRYFDSSSTSATLDTSAENLGKGCATCDGTNCTFVMSGEEDRHLTCVNGATCEITLGDAAFYRIDCLSGSTCTIDGEANALIWCQPGATCDLPSGGLGGNCWIDRETDASTGTTGCWRLCRDEAAGCDDGI